MTYDPSRQQLVVVGGVFSDQSTWGFDGTTWQKIADPIEEISLGGDPEIIYDPEIQSLVMYYANANSESSDTYLLQSGVWSKQTLTTQPPGAMDSAFLYDPSRKEGIWFEGNETWTWNHTQWIQKNPTNRPEMEWGYFNMAFDTIHNEAILFGNGQTWSWNGEEWTRLQPIESPTNPERGFFAMGFDESRDAVVLWGGELLLSMSPYQTSYLDDIWEWDGTTWQQRSSTAIVNWKSY